MATTKSNIMGRPPRAMGTGPRNLAKSLAEATSRVRASRPKTSRAPNVRVSPSRASAGYGRPPAGGGSGTPKATSSIVRSPGKTINKPKSGRPKRGLGKPRADFPSKI